MFPAKSQVRFGELTGPSVSIVTMALDSPPDVLADGERTDREPDRPDGPDPATAPWARRRSRVLVAAAVVVALVGLGGWWFFLRSDEPTSTGITTTQEVVEVSTGTFGETVAAEGTVAAAGSEDLGFTSAGTVTALDVAAGDTVVVGQVLATIDSAELEEAVADAEADLADAEAQLSDDEDAGADDDQLEADAAWVTTAQDALENAQESLEGASLVAGIDGLVTSVELTVGEELDSGGSGGTTVTGSGSGSGQSASSMGSNNVAAAPEATGAAGTDATSSAPVQIQIVSAGTYEVELAVDTADIDSVAVGQAVDLTISTDSAGTTATATGPGGFGPPGGFPGATPDEDGEEDPSDSSGSSSDDVTATGMVTEVSRVADASSGVAKYDVTVGFTADAGQVWVGSAASAEINVTERDEVTQVSSRAVSTTAGVSVVTVALEGTVDGATEERTIETGEASAQMTEVVSGLEPGEFVIVEVPSFGAREGIPGGGEPPGGVQPPDGVQVPDGVQLPGAGPGQG